MARAHPLSSQGSQSHLHNQKITTFFQPMGRTSSQSQLSSSQLSMLSSSQLQTPTASQVTAGPSSSQRRPLPASQSAKTPPARPKPKPLASTSTHDTSPLKGHTASQTSVGKTPHKRKSEAEEAGSHPTPTTIDLVDSSDALSHISISSNSAVRVHSQKKSKSSPVILVSDSSDHDHVPIRPSTLSPGGVKARMRTRNGSGAKGASTSAAGKAKSKSSSKAKATPIKSKPATQPPSAAKTTIKKRPKFVPPEDPGRVSPIIAERKRKRRLLKDFDEDSTDEDALFDAGPERLPEALRSAPKILTREDLLAADASRSGKGKGNAKESANTGAVGNRETSTHSTSSSSKRRRITPSSPLTSPPGSPHHFSQDLPDFPTANETDLDLVALPGPVAELATPDADVEHARLVPTSLNQKLEHRAPASSGNEADEEEEIPSSQSDEQELTLPKAITKDPKEVKARVDQWRRSSLSVAGASEGEEEQVKAQLPAISEGETTLSDGDLPVPSGLLHKSEHDANANAMSSPDPMPESFPASDFDNNDTSMDVDTDFDIGLPPLSVPPTPEHDATMDMDNSLDVEEEEVSQQLKDVPQSSSVSPLSTVPSSPTDTHPATPTTPPPGETSQPEIAGGSPFKSAPFETFGELFRSATPPPPEPEVGEQELPILPPTPVKLDTKAKTQNLIDQIKAQALASVAESDEDESKVELKLEWEESSDSGSELEFKYDFSKCVPGLYFRISRH